MLTNVNDADEAIRKCEEEFDGVCVYDVSSSEVISDFTRIIKSCKTIGLNITKQGNWKTNVIFPSFPLDTVKIIGECSECGCKDAVCHEVAMGYYKGTPIIYQAHCPDGCSDEIVSVIRNASDNIKKRNYCPNCGACMIYEEKRSYK